MRRPQVRIRLFISGQPFQISRSIGMHSGAKSARLAGKNAREPLPSRCNKVPVLLPFGHSCP